MTPFECTLEQLTMGERTGIALDRAALATASCEVSPRERNPDSARSWTTADSEGSLEASFDYFEAVVPVVRTARPASVPPLAIPNGDAAGGGCGKWPFEAALSGFSGKSTALSSSVASGSLQTCLSRTGSRTSGSLQASSRTSPHRLRPSAARPAHDPLAPLRHAHDVESRKGPLKVSQPCAPAIRKKAELSPQWHGEGPDSKDMEVRESAWKRDDDDEDSSSSIDEEAMDRIENCLGSCPALADEILSVELSGAPEQDPSGEDQENCFDSCPALADEILSTRLPGAPKEDSLGEDQEVVLTAASARQHSARQHSARLGGA